MKHGEDHHHQMEQYGTTWTFPQTGCPSKMDENMRKKLVRGKQQQIATLKKLQEYLAGTGTCDKISLCVLHKCQVFVTKKSLYQGT